MTVCSPLRRSSRERDTGTSRSASLGATRLPGFRTVGDLINDAVERTLAAGTRTPDLVGTVGTAAFGAAVVAQVAEVDIAARQSPIG